MCGINGIYGGDLGRRADLVLKMNHLLEHRGPDAHAVYEDDNVALGHTRLKIIDLSETANQPMECAFGRFVLIFNGEIYNYKQLRSELSTYPYKTQGDSEVILAAYHKYGEGAIEKLDGQFAFSIWDKEKRQLIIARDRIGIKNIYYYQTNDVLIFSSEIRPLINSGILPKKMDSDSLVDYLRYQTVHAPNTIIEGIKQLMPGHYYKISDDESAFVNYWDIRKQLDPLSVYHSKEEAQKNVRQLFTEAVEKRLVADVPFGAFLSGGIDSSLVVGVMSQVLNNPVRTFNVSFDESDFSEAKYAKLISKKFKTDHSEILLKPEDFLNIIPSAMNDMDHPSGDGFNTWLVSKVTKEAGVTMALSGLGGDELFGGYAIFKRYVELMDKKWLLSFPMGIRRAAASLLKKIKPGISSEKVSRVLVQEYFDLENIYQFDRQVLLDDQVERILSRKTLSSKSVYEIIRSNVGFESEGYHLSPLSRVSWAEMNTYMQNVLLRDADQMSMAHSLEIRVPFLDHKLIEYVMGLNDTIKYPSTPKKLLVDSFSDILPDEIVNRPKMGFVFPWEHWLKNELSDFALIGLQKLKDRKAFNADEIDGIWKQFLNNDPRVSWSRIWPMVVLGNWIESNGID